MLAAVHGSTSSKSPLLMYGRTCTCAAYARNMMSKQAAIWKEEFLPNTTDVMAMQNLRKMIARIHMMKSGLNWK